MTIKQSGIFHHSHDDCILDLQLILKKKKNLKNHIYATFPLMLHITYSILKKKPNLQLAAILTHK